MRIKLDPDQVLTAAAALKEVAQELAQCSMMMSDILEELKRRPTLAVAMADPRLVQGVKGTFGGLGTHPRP